MTDQGKMTNADRVALITPDLARRLLKYDPNTGKLWWRARTPDMFENGRYGRKANCSRWNTCRAGEEALATVSPRGYRRGTINGAKVLAHRIIWLIVYGEWPEVIDHINGNRLDNRIINLRNSTPSGNMHNKRMSINNTSGCTGVSYNKSRGKWKAYIYHDGDNHWLGYFGKFEDAKKARSEAETRLGFSARHGI